MSTSGEEEPELRFFQITKKTGRITDHFEFGLYRFDRRKLNKNTGNGFFNCSVPDCSASLTAKYEAGQPIPLPTNISNIRNHVLKTTGVEHEACVSSNFVNVCKARILSEIQRTPGRPVLEIYEEIVNSTREDLRGLDQQEILENFDLKMPPAQTFLRSMY